MPQIADHPLRYRLTNELHARPFPSLSAPCRAVFLAIKPQGDASGRDRTEDLDHLRALLDRFGAAHPQPGATHYSGRIGRHTLKWESHTEFVTFTVFLDGLGERPFDAADAAVFPADWLASAPGVCMTRVLVRVIPADPGDAAAGAQIDAALSDWFVPESLAVSQVVDGDAVIAGDFHIDPAGFQRFAVFARPGVGNGRIGRVVQRLTEIETYKTMSMLGFARVRDTGPKLNEIDDELTRLIEGMSEATVAAEDRLQDLLRVAAELESLQAQMAFRLGATGAYEAIVGQRIEVLREDRFHGRQTFGEFMMRRYDPAMRTVKAHQTRLDNLAARATRAGELLRTRVEVQRSAQNQSLLESMNRRADMQLRLQETVEGLSVVAISYYAVSLAAYMLAPLAGGLGLSKTLLTALVAPPVIALVWLMVRRIRNSVDHGD